MITIDARDFFREHPEFKTIQALAVLKTSLSPRPHDPQKRGAVLRELADYFRIPNEFRPDAKSLAVLLFDMMSFLERMSLISLHDIRPGQTVLCRDGDTVVEMTINGITDNFFIRLVGPSNRRSTRSPQRIISNITT